jgi:hypothetical protein
VSSLLNPLRALVHVQVHVGSGNRCSTMHQTAN